MFRSIFLELQFLLDVIEIFLIHVGEEVLRFLLLVPDELGGVGLHLCLGFVADF